MNGLGLARLVGGWGGGVNWCIDLLIGTLIEYGVE